MQDEQFGLQANAGVESSRAIFSWQKAESRPGLPTDWGDTDPMVERAARAGIELLPVVINAPRWARENPRAYASPPKDPNDYADFMEKLIGRYGEQGTFWTEHPDVPKRPLRTWQIWNEPHLRFQWDTDAPYARGYGKLLRVAYKRIKRVDPGATVVMAALSNESWKFLAELYKKGRVRGYYDVAAFHPYTRRPSGVVTLARRFRIVMRRNRDSRKPLWITELGLPASKGKEKSKNPLQTTDEKMADFLTTSMEHVIARQTERNVRVSRVYWYTWASFYCCGDIFRYTGLRAYDPRDDTFEDKPAMAAYKESARRHEDCEKTETATCAPPVARSRAALSGRYPRRDDPDDPVVALARRPAAVRVVREQVDRPVGSLDDLAQAAVAALVELPVALHGRAVEGDPAQLVAAQGGDEEVAAPLRPALVHEGGAGRRDHVLVVDHRRGRALVALGFRPAVVAALLDQVDLVVRVRAELGRVEAVRARLPVEALHVAMAGGDDLGPHGAAARVLHAQDLAVQRAGVLRQARVAGLARRDVERAVGAEADPAAVVHHAAGDPSHDHPGAGQPAARVLVAQDLVAARSRPVQVDELVRREARVERDAEQAALALGGDLDGRGRLRDGLQVLREAPDAAVALGHEGAAVGQEDHVPGHVEARGDRARPSRAAWAPGSASRPSAGDDDASFGDAAASGVVESSPPPQAIRTTEANSSRNRERIP